MHAGAFMKKRYEFFSRKKLILTGWVFAAFVAGYFLRGGSESERVERREHEIREHKTETWTCSMHPQIKMPKPGKCPICFMDLIPLETDDDEEAGLRELSLSEASARLMDIQTAPVERRFVSVDLHMVGEVDYDETRMSYITAWVPGRLDRLFVDYIGVSVKKGEQMVDLYSPELLSAQQELIQAVRASKKLQQSDVQIVHFTTDVTVDAVREKLRLWGLTEAQVADIEKRGTASEHITITAPVSGIVIQKNAQQGMYVKTGTRIYTLADLSTVWVRLNAYESDLVWLKDGQAVLFSTEAYPGETFEGRISFIAPILDRATRTVKVRVNVPNAEMRLKPGMFVRASVQVRAGANGTAIDEHKPLVIPATAVLLTGRRAIVYVQLPNQQKPTFEGREIVLGPRAGDSYIVRRGLRDGERVVTKGSFKLDSELQIRAKPSMMTPDGGGGGGAHAHHEGMNMDTETPATVSRELSPLVMSQLNDVVSAAQYSMDAVSAGDPAKAKEAFKSLVVSVDEVDSTLLEADKLTLWKEYAMLLGNDGVEGLAAKTKKELLQTAEVTGWHLDAMRTRLGVKFPVADTETMDINRTFTSQLNEVINQYITLQAALAADDLPAALKDSKQTLAALEKVDMSLVSGEIHMKWMKQYAPLKKILTDMTSASMIESLRQSFSPLSEQITAVVRTFKPTEGKVYDFHCPMAFDNQGANWLQKNDDIANPYFGAMMLKCGSMENVLPGSK